MIVTYDTVINLSLTSNATHVRDSGLDCQVGIHVIQADANCLMPSCHHVLSWIGMYILHAPLIRFRLVPDLDFWSLPQLGDLKHYSSSSGLNSLLVLGHLR